MKVRKAVIPAAGLGTRMLPLTRCLPKELLPVGKLPMMQYAIEEAAATGVEELYIIINKERKKLTEDYFSNGNWHLSNFYDSKQNDGNHVSCCQLIFLDQEESRGVADAIQISKKYIGTDPFFVLMPDNVFFGSEPSIAQLLRCFAEYNKNILGLIEVKKEEADFYGNSGKVELRPLNHNVYSIDHLGDKAPLARHFGEEARIIRCCGRYILRPEFFYEAEERKRDMSTELDDVPILQKLIKKNSVLGVILQGKLFDCGHWEGYWAANQYWNDSRRKWN